MLYGKNYIFGGKNPYKRTKMRMGYKKIKIDGIISIGKKYYIKRTEFHRAQYSQSRWKSAKDSNI